MEERKLDILGPKEEQLKILVPYLEAVARGKEAPLPMTLRTRTLVGRYLWHWKGLYTSEGLTPEGAFLYYRKLKEDK